MLHNRYLRLGTIGAWRCCVDRLEIPRERCSVFAVIDYARVGGRRTDFGRAQASMRLSTAHPMATSVC